MKKNIFILFSAVCLISLYNIAHAQEYEYDNIDPQKVIVRTYHDSCQILYAEQNNSTNFLILRTPTVNKIFKLPYGMKINDMEVYSSAVGFCGSYNGKGTAGLFHALDVFDGTDGLLYFTCTSPCIFQQQYYNDTYIKIKEFLKVDINYTSTNGYYLAMIASAYLDTNDHYLTNIVASAHFISSNQWRIECLYEEGQPIIYSDIKCLDNVIVASGTTSDSGNLAIKTFQKTTEFLQYPLTPGFSQKVCEYFGPSPSTLTTQIKDNIAAFAIHTYKGTHIHRLSINPTTGAVTLFRPSVSIKPDELLGVDPINWRLYDLRRRALYPLTDTTPQVVFLLENAAHKNNGYKRNIIRVFTHSSPSTLVAYRDNIYDMQSIDSKLMPSEVFRAGVSTNGHLSLSNNTIYENPNACAEGWELPAVYFNPIIGQMKYSSRAPHKTAPVIPFYPQISTIQANQICPQQ